MVWLVLSEWRAESQGTSTLGRPWIEGLVMGRGDTVRGALQLGAGGSDLGSG